MRAELDLVARGGIDTVVDLTTVGLGRRPAALAEISERSGVHVVLATGYHRDAHYAADHWVHREDAGVLLDVVLTDLRTAIDDRDWRGPAPRPTAVRAGVVKVGASYQRMTAGERRRIEVGPNLHVVGGIAQEVVDHLTARDAAFIRPNDVAAGQIGGQALRLGLVDQIVMNVVPVVFGSGRPFFGAMDPGDVITLDNPTRVAQGDRVTHLLYDVS